MCFNRFIRIVEKYFFKSWKYKSRELNSLITKVKAIIILFCS